MATYADIRTDILITLDQDPEATGDIYDLVNIKMKSVLLEIISRVWPQELLTLSNTFEVTDAITSVSIATDLLITDMLKPFTLMVNEDPDNADSSAYAWKYLNPEVYLRGFHRLVGAVQPQKSFTLLNDTLTLYPWPTTGTTYDIAMWYYKEPVTITDNGVPEFPKQHHSVLVHGVCKQFPHLFAGDRTGLFATIIQNYDEGIKALIDDMDATNTEYQLTLSPTMRISGTRNQNINWGGRQTS